MKPTMEILTKLQENSMKNHDEVFTRLYRYLLRPDIYYVAYKHLNVQLFRIGTDWAASNAIVAGTLIRLSHKIHFERGRIMFFLFRRVPLIIFTTLFLFSALPLAVFRSVFAKYHLMW